MTESMIWWLYLATSRSKCVCAWPAAQRTLALDETWSSTSGRCRAARSAAGTRTYTRDWKKNRSTHEQHVRTRSQNKSPASRTLAKQKNLLAMPIFKKCQMLADILALIYQSTTTKFLHICFYENNIIDSLMESKSSAN